MGGRSDPTLAAPFPPDPVDPPDPVECSKNGVFVVRVVILGLGGALAWCEFDFFRMPRVNHLLSDLQTQNLYEQGLENSLDFARATVLLRISLRSSWN